MMVIYIFNITLKSVAVEENSGLYASVYPGSFSVSLTILRRLNITVRQSRQSGVARATCPD